MFTPNFTRELWSVPLPRVSTALRHAQDACLNRHAPLEHGVRPPRQCSQYHQSRPTTGRLACPRPQVLAVDGRVRVTLGPGVFFGEDALLTVRACPGRFLRGLSACHCEPVFYGAFAWARRALNHA